MELPHPKTFQTHAEEIQESSSHCISDSKSVLCCFEINGQASFSSEVQHPSLDHHILDSCRSTVFLTHTQHIQLNPTCTHLHGYSIPIVLCCGVLTHRPHNLGPLLCLYFPTKTASEMYGLCFWVWPRPKATPRLNPQPWTSSPSRVRRG